MIKTLKTMGLDQENNTSGKTKEIQSTGVPWNWNKMHQLSLSQHPQKQNKRKNAAILILLLTKSYVFNILLLVFS
jgi:hypothetical protein